MNIKPGAWVIINSGLALRHTDCGVTPQPQNTGISPACIVEASPKSGLEISPQCQNSCHPHPNNLNGGKGDNHGTIQCRTQTSHTKQTFIT